MTDSGLPEVKPSLTTNGHVLETLKRGTPSSSSSTTTRSSPSWDEDWVSNKSTLQPSTTNMPFGQPSPVTNTNSQTPIGSAHQTPLSCPPVDLEWPPRSSSSFPSTPQLAKQQQQNKSQNGSSSSNSTFDDFDPFADWPPRPTSGSGSVSGPPIRNGSIAPPVNKNIVLGFSSSSSIIPNNGINGSWGFSTPSSGSEPLRQQQNQGNLAFLNSAWSSSSNQKSATDIGSIFGSSSNNEKTNANALRLAPPPSTAVGRGRGRGNQAQMGARSSRPKSSADQPPLLDLL